MNSSATLTGCDGIIKRLREAIAWLRAQQHIFDSHPKTATDKTPGSIAENIAALLDRLDAAERENERLRSESKAQLEELDRIDDALGTNEGPSAVDHIMILKTENERLRAERDEHARWREKLADDLHERESQIIDGWAALRASGVQSEKSIADGIRLLRAENEALRRSQSRRVGYVCEQCGWTLSAEPPSDERREG